MAKLPTALLPRSLPSGTSTSLLSNTSRPASRIIPRQITTTQQVRHATEIVRPKRPFTFTQIIQLSDGSTYTTRSTSPLPVYKSTKDSRNHLTWQPSEKSLQNIEVDEAGKLAAFRGRFGLGYELGASTDGEEEGAGDGTGRGAEEEDSLANLMAGYVRDDPALKGGQVASNRVSKKGKKK